MKKYFTYDNLITLCWGVAILHVLISLLKYFFNIATLRDIDYCCFAVVIAFVIAHFLLFRPKIYFRADVTMLCVMIAYFVISCICMSVASDKDYFSANSVYFTDLEAALLFFVLGKISSKNGLSSLQKHSMHIFLLLCSAVMLFILIIVFSNTVFYSPFTNGPIGMYEGTDLVINCNRNETGAMAMVLLLLCFCMIFWTKKTLFKALYAVSCIIHYFILVLSNSRTALVAAVVGFTGLVGLVIFQSVRKKCTPAFSVTIAIASAIVSGLFFSLLRASVYNIYSIIVTGNGGVGMDVRTVFDPADPTLSNRTVIWKISIGLLLTIRPLLSGLTPIGIQESLGFIDQTHNEFLEVGCGLGIPALCAFLIFLTIVAVKCFKIIFFGHDQSLKLATILILAYLTANMAEARLMFYGWFIGYAFFFLCGYITNYDLSNTALSQ